MLDLPLWLQFGFSLVGAGAVVVGVYKAGQHDSMRKNGYVTRVDCRANIATMKESLSGAKKERGALHEKINGVAIDTAEIKGILQARAGQGG